MKRIVCIIGSTHVGSLSARRVEYLVRELSQVEGVTVITDGESPEPANNQGVSRLIDHLDCDHKRTLVGTVILGLAGSRIFDIKLAVLKPQQTAGRQLPKMCRLHTERARKEIKRFGLDPRVMKRQRGRRFR